MIVQSLPLKLQTAQDVMSKEVMTLSRHMSLRSAARLLAQNLVSGAPVVDENGACIGVISSMDFLKQNANMVGKATDSACRDDCACVPWQLITTEEIPTDEVSHYMTRDPVVVSADTSLITVARMMVDAHIHRVIVVDADRKPVGVVSSTDIVAAVARVE